jgi:hypothetical protein
MRRHAHTVHLARIRIDNLLGQLDHTRIEEWSKHLRSATKFCHGTLLSPLPSRSSRDLCRRPILAHNASIGRQRPVLRLGCAGQFEALLYAWQTARRGRQRGFAISSMQR